MKELLRVCLLLLFFVAGTAGAYAQRTVTGTVVDQDQQPVTGSNVIVKGTNTGAITDLQGKFSISVPSGGGSLVVSFIGYITQEVPIGTSNVINITLETESKYLSEVVVVGYGTQRKLEVTGAIASVNSETLTQLPTGTVGQALQGRAAGLTVINNGSPGSQPTLRIRGISTVNNNDPLYVVDGVIASSISNLNPMDIESIQILKDASTAAIYGSQGSNGVIMVTTKKGATGIVKISLDAYGGTQWTDKRFDVLNTAQYIQYATSGAFAAPPVMSDPQYAGRLAAAETNWQDKIFQNGMMQNYNLGLSGGSENTTYRISAGYLSQDGIIINTGYERYNFRANSDFTKGKFKMGENIALSFGNQKPEIQNGGRSLIEHSIKMAPYLPVYNPDNLGGFQGPTSAAEIPVRIMELNTINVVTTSILGDIYAEYEIIKGLKFKTVLGLEDLKINNNQHYPSYNDDNLGASTHSAASSTNAKYMTAYRSFIFTNTLNYTKTFADKHNIEALLLAESSSITQDLLNASSQNPISREIEQLNNTQSNLSSSASEYKRIGYLGRLNYNYDQKYLLALSVRKDASSRFGENNRWATFPSVAAGWRINKEAFMSDMAALSNLKIRGSWGKAGNDKIGNYTYATTLTSNMNYTFDNLAYPGTTPSGFSNPDLKWEETTMLNIGLDLGLFKDRFTLSAEYFVNTSDDLLMSVPITPSLGVFSGTRSENAGSVETRGFEFQLGYNDSEGDFRWSANLNVGTFKNEVLSLGQAQFIAGGGFENENLVRATVGQPLFYFYGYKFDGIFQSDAEATSYMGGSQSLAKAGDFRIMDVGGPADANGNPTAPDGKIDANDRTNIGNPFPKVTLGLDLNGSYKGFDLNVFISGVYGNDIYNTNIYDLEGMSRLFNAGVSVLDRWTPTNPSNTIPRAQGAETNLQASTRYIEDGDFTRLRNLTLGYTIPSTVLKSIPALRIYISAQNLITFTKYNGLDPEIGNPAVQQGGAINVQAASSNFGTGIDIGTYPQPKSVIAGIQITF
jgi:TonB-linked SusC/RagA family outer membrane protein